jgi:AhpD family alkylhydroperoxidase
MQNITAKEQNNLQGGRKFMKRLYCPKDFFRMLEDMFASMGAMRRGRKQGLVSTEFAERIMMAVTEVNGCRYCSYFHSQVALKAGLSDSEIRETLSGDFSNTPEEELPALMFGQHYAETGGRPDPQTWQRLVETYGQAKAEAIRGNIRTIMIGNAWGNAFDSLRVRLKGRPNSEMNLLQEIAVILGPILMMPVVLIKLIVLGLKRS